MPRSTAPADQKEDRSTAARGMFGLLVTVVIALVVITPLVVAATSTPVATDEKPNALTNETVNGTATETTTVSSTVTETTNKSIDVVFVMDSSQSTNENRYHMAQEIGALATAFNGSDIDARYALLTYNRTVAIQQNMTGEFDAIDRAMHYQTGGSVEYASEAILAVQNLSLRDDAETVVVLMTDEDDDNNQTVRKRAIEYLSGIHFVAISPPTAHESSCAIHSPPCDSDTANELLNVTQAVDGGFIGVNNSAESIVAQIGTTIMAELAADPNETTPKKAVFERVAVEANRTTVEVGQSVAVTAAVKNNGTANGTYQAYLSEEGQILDELAVPIAMNETRNITLVTAFESPGTHQLLVTHEPAVTINVTEPPETTTEQQIETTESNQTSTETETTVSTTETETTIAPTETTVTTSENGAPSTTMNGDDETESSIPDVVIWLAGFALAGIGIVAYRRH